MPPQKEPDAFETANPFTAMPTIVKVVINCGYPLSVWGPTSVMPMTLPTPFMKLLLMKLLNGAATSSTALSTTVTKEVNVF